MKRARDARYGRVIAKERGAFEPNEQPLEIPHPPMQSAMIYRLNIESLESLSEFCGLTLKQFEEKYA